MKKYIIALFAPILLTVLFALPTTSSAQMSSSQVGDVDPGSGEAECVNLTVNMRLGSNDALTGGQVTALQNFLIDKGYLSVEATGTFGRLTFNAVKKFQSNYGLLASGYVGPLTRAQINSACSVTTGSGPTSTSPAIPPDPAKGKVEVISPNGGQTIDPSESFKITFKAIPGKNHYLNLVNKSVSGGTAYQLTPLGGNYDSSVIGTSNEYQIVTVKIPSQFNVPSGSYYKIEVCAIYGCDESDSYLTVVSPTSPPQPSNESRVKAAVLSETGDKAGVWYQFNSDGVKDWVWDMTLSLSSAKKIKSIGIVHNVSGEGWSTASDQSLLGKILYPIVVVTQDGKQLNAAYDQYYAPSTNTPAFGSYEFPAGTYSYKLYGNTGAVPFTGGKIVVTFTDGTSASAAIPASSYSPSNPPAPRPEPPLPVTASFDVKLSPITPVSKTVLAGTNNVTLTVLKVVNSSNKDINLSTLGLRFDGSNVNALVDGRVLVWDGSTQIGTGYFVNSSKTAVVAFPTSISIPPYYSKDITIKGDLSLTGVAQPAQAGDTIVVNYDGTNMSATSAKSEDGIIYSSTPYSTSANTTTLGVPDIVVMPVPTVPVTPSPAVPPPVVTVPDTYSLALYSTTEDKAAAWGGFGPGVGNGSRTAADWGWSLNLSISKDRKITSMRMNHNYGGEYWTTNDSSSYPLVVFENGTQLNGAYGSSISLTAGKHTLMIYGQKEYQSYLGAKLTINFDDGSSVTVDAPSASAFNGMSQMASPSVIFNNYRF